MSTEEENEHKKSFNEKVFIMKYAGRGISISIFPSSSLGCERERVTARQESGENDSVKSSNVVCSSCNACST